MLASGQASSTEIRLLRFPTVHGNSVVFSYAGDLWSCELDGGIAKRLTSHVGPELNARFSPDGKTIAFMGGYDGMMNVYVMPSEGGEPKRVTFGTGETMIGGWTKDGKILYADWDQNTNPDRPQPAAWFVDPKGGLPEATPVKEFWSGTINDDNSILAYNRGNSFAFNWRRYRGGTQGIVEFFNLKTNQVDHIPSGRENNWHPMWVGDTVYYLSDKEQGTVNLYSFNTKSRKSQKLTNFGDADIRFPNTDGKTIVFERNGILCAYDIASKNVKSISPRVISDGISVRPQLRKVANYLQGVALSPSGKRAIIEARGELFSVPAKNGETRNMTQSSGARDKGAVWSPDGQTILYMSDSSGEWELYTMPQRGGKATALTSGGKYMFTGGFAFSPDGKKVSFGTLDKKLMILDLATKKVTQVNEFLEGSADNYDWAPDSSYIAYAETLPSLNSSVVMYRVRDGKTTRITDGFYNDAQLSFDLNGKYLYVMSMRNFEPAPNALGLSVSLNNPYRVYAIPLTKDMTNPFQVESDEEPEKKGDDKPSATSMDIAGGGGDDEDEFTSNSNRSFLVQEKKEAAAPQPPPAAQPVTPPAEKKKEEPKELKVDFDGISKRLIALPWPGGNFQGIIGINNGVLAVIEGRLVRFDFDSKQSMDILPGFTALNFNQNRTKMIWGLGPQLFITPVAPQMQPGAGRVNLDAVEMMWDPKAEWEQIFNEAWRYYRDRFYDAQMLGIDWNAVKKQYGAYLPYVTNRADLNYVLGMMIGETGTGHSYVGGGDMGARPMVPTGLLGADYDFSGGNVRFKKIYVGEGFEAGNRGPLAEPGMNVKVGDYLLEIDGKAVGGKVWPQALLQGKIGRSVTLTINDKPSLTGSRKVVVKPIGSDGQIRYDDWVEANRKLVDKLSGGKIGYLHIPNTSEEGMIGFAKGYFAQSDKEALLLDERYNGGGNIPTYFYDVILRKSITYLRQRHGVDVGFPTQTMDGPMAMLINEQAGSGGDHLPWLFRKYKVGKLIGKRTWGGLVGIAGAASLVDGGFITSPEFGLYDPEAGKYIAENMGIDPDIDVDYSFDVVAQGRDPQIEKGVAYLLEEIKKHPKRKPIRPEYPRIK